MQYALQNAAPQPTLQHAVTDLEQQRHQGREERGGDDQRAVHLRVLQIPLLPLQVPTQPGLHAQAGARIQYRWNSENRPEFISAKLIDATGQEREIDTGATYRVVTIDYLLKLGGGSYAILQEGKNVTPLGLTIRDAIMEYVKAETAAGRPVRARLDDRFVQVGPDPAKSEAPPQ